MEESFLKNVSILIVDDSTMDLEIISKSLSRYFKKVYSANNGSDAYQLYQQNKNIDIIISDIQMPKINGLELLELIRRSDMYIPYLIVSATFDQDILIKAINLNVSSFLPKPINLQSLIEKIDMLCERKYFKYKEELRKNEIQNYLDSVNSVACIYKMKEDGVITYMNTKMLEISGYNENDIPKLTFDDIIHPDVPNKYIENTWKILNEGKLWKGNTKFIKKNKEEFYLNNTIFKSVSDDDSYITIAFSTTKENKEKREFHKKVIHNINSFHLKENSYKKKIEELNSQKQNLMFLSTTTSELEEKVRRLSSQIEKYEEELTEKDKKYNHMLKSKKAEIEHFIEKAQKEMLKAAVSNEESSHMEKNIKIIAKQNIMLKDENKKAVKRIKDLEELLKIKKANKNI